MGVNSELFTLPAPSPLEADDLEEALSAPSAAVVDTVRRHPGPYMVLGAGGKMGLHLCLMLRRALVLAGREPVVHAVSRFSSLRERDEFEGRGLTPHVCDLCDPAALAALPDAGVIFFLAGVKFGTSTAPELLNRINGEMPRQVAERFRGVRTVAFSTGCVYPFVEHTSGGATEDTPVSPNGAYAASCVLREQAFIDASVRHGTPAAIIRLNYSVELRYGLLLDIATRVLRGEPVDVTTGHVNVIWQRDAIDHIVRSLDIAASPAAILNVTGAETLAVRDLAQRFGRRLGTNVTITGTEAETAWLNNASRSHQLFGVPPVSTDQMIDWIAQWLQRGGSTWAKPTGFERRDGNF